MKSTIFSILALCVLFSCHTDAPLNNGIFSIKKNGTVLTGDVTLRLDKTTDTLYIFAIAHKPNEEVIGMTIKFNGTGEYTLTKNQAFYYATVGGDVIVSEYKLPENTTARVVISRYTTGDKIVEGTFTMTLHQSMSNPPNTINILTLEEGTFKARIVN
jgi:hypothetical protein